MTDQAPVNEADAVTLPSAPVANSPAKQQIMAMEAGHDLAAVVPRTLEEAFRFAQLVVNAGLCPNSYETAGRPDPQKVVIGILSGLEVGVPPMQALKGIAIINGRPAIWGDLAIALIQSKNLIEDMEHHYTGTDGEDDWTCHVVIKRRHQDKPYDGRFSVKDAKRAKLWNNPSKQPWILYPNRMLFNRARAFALRDGFADALAGLAIREELEDMPAAPAPVALEFLDDPIENTGTVEAQTEKASA